MSGRERYGYYKFGYGSVEDESSTRSLRFRFLAERVTPEQAFGAGIALATNEDEDSYDWDFVIDHTGALAVTVGIDEFLKDMAFQTAREFHQLLGGLNTPEERADLELEIISIFQSDDRILDIRSVSVTNFTVDSIDVEVSIIGEDNALHEDIFPVPLPEI